MSSEKFAVVVLFNEEGDFQTTAHTTLLLDTLRRADYVSMCEIAIVLNDRPYICFNQCHGIRDGQLRSGSCLEHFMVMVGQI